MSKYIGIGFALSCSLVFIGCQGSNDSTTVTLESPTGTTKTQRVSLHVAGMREKQGLNCLGCENKVRDTLAELPGVGKKNVEVIFKEDVLRIRYDPSKITPQEMLAAIEKVEPELKFKGEIVTGP
jgi:copper chaperone CopZ